MNRVPAADSHEISCLIGSENVLRIHKIVVCFFVICGVFKKTFKESLMSRDIVEVQFRADVLSGQALRL